MPLEVVKSEQESLRYGIRINWGGIFCGSFLTLATGLIFVLLGNAAGISAQNLVSPTASPMLVAWSFVYNFITLALSFYVGAYAASRLGAVSHGSASTLHGLSTWALAGVSIVGYGITLSPMLKDIIGGTGPNVANWFIFCLSAVTCGVAALGGYNGRVSMKGAEKTRREGVESRAA